MSQQMFALSFGLAAALAADLAHSAPQCDSRETLTALLADRYAETRRALGIAGQAAAVMELYASDATGTWSITVTLPDGRMCLMASGANYETVTEDLRARGDPA